MRLGLCMSGNTPMREVVDGAHLAEAAGWDSVWLGEDYFYRGGATMAAAVATATSRITIGLGIMTPLPRHPALIAMEVASLQELSGNRILPGIGAGVAVWMRQMGFDYSSPLGIMREGVEVTRRLLAGDMVTVRGKIFNLDRVKLNFPSTPTPILLGAVGPKALQLAGEIADGTVLSVLAGREYVEWALDRIKEGQAAAGRIGHPHLVVAYLFLALSDTRETGRNLVRPVVAEYLSAGGANALSRAAGIGDAVAGELNREYVRGHTPVERITDDMVDAVAAAGPPEYCAGWIRRLVDAGVDVVAVLPVPLDRTTAEVRKISGELLPLCV